jgi:hypothetical protein
VRRAIHARGGNGKVGNIRRRGKELSLRNISSSSELHRLGNPRQSGFQAFCGKFVQRNGDTYENSIHCQIRNKVANKNNNRGSEMLAMI